MLPPNFYIESFHRSYQRFSRSYQRFRHCFELAGTESPFSGRTEPLFTWLPVIIKPIF